MPVMRRMLVEGVHVDTAGVAEDGAVDVEEIGVLAIPGKAGLDMDAW